MLRATCDSLVHFCGGDSQRTFDLKRRSIDDTLQHALRVRAFHDRQRSALCLVHETAELHETLELRSVFENLVPIAQSAVWAIMWDHHADPGFLERIQTDGTLIGDVSAGATWRHTSGAEFLLLSPLVENFEALAVEADCMARSRSARRQDQLVSTAHASL
jgi:hypothetical protein